MTDVPSLLPPTATAFERRVEQTLARIGQVSAPVNALWNPQTCPVELLPWLAWTMAVDVWRSDWPEATKRAVIAAAPQIHRLKGTVAAVKSAIASVAGEEPSQLIEWFQAGGSGEPYTALVEVDATDAATAGTALELQADLRQAVEAVKPLRSRLTLRLKLAMGSGVSVAPVLRRAKTGGFLQAWAAVPVALGPIVLAPVTSLRKARSTTLLQGSV